MARREQEERFAPPIDGLLERLAFSCAEELGQIEGIATLEQGEVAGDRLPATIIVVVDLDTWIAPAMRSRDSRRWSRFSSNSVSIFWPASNSVRSEEEIRQAIRSIVTEIEKEGAGSSPSSEDRRGPQESSKPKNGAKFSALVKLYLIQPSQVTESDVTSPVVDH